MAHYNTEEDVKEGKKKAKMEGLRSKGYSEVDALKMVSMKKEKKSGEDMPSTAPASADDGESYPYGLRIRLENDEMEKLGFTDLPEVGKVCKIEAEGVVESVSSNQSKGSEGSRKSVEIQITKMATSKAESSSDEDTDSDKNS